MGPPEPPGYAELLRYAARVTARSDEAEDLLQTVLLAAIEAGRNDLSKEANRRWMKGALKKRAAFDARSAVRRKARDARHGVEPAASEPTTEMAAFVQGLPPALGTTAQLALAGHTRDEIRWLLGISDAALRQRIAQIRKRWRALDGRGVVGLPGLTGALAFGEVRKALLGRMERGGTVLASHDPDGNLFVLRSQNAGPRQPGIHPPSEE